MLDIPTATTYPSTRPALHVVRDEESPPYDAAFEPPPVVEKPAGGFAMIPSELGWSIIAQTTPSAYIVYWHLAARSKDGKCFPSLDDITEHTKLSRMHVTRCLKALEEGGFISRKQRTNKYGMTTSTEYTLHHLVRTDGSNTAVTLPEHCPPRNVTGTRRELESNYVTPSGVTKPPKSPTPKKVSMPLGFDLSPDRMAYAVEHGLSQHEAEELFEDMRLWAKQGGKYLDWHAAWQTWVRRLVQKRSESAPVHRNGYQNGRAAKPSISDMMDEAMSNIERKKVGGSSVIEAAFTTGDRR